MRVKRDNRVAEQLTEAVAVAQGGIQQVLERRRNEARQTGSDLS